MPSSKFRFKQVSERSVTSEPISLHHEILQDAAVVKEILDIATERSLEGYNQTGSIIVQSLKAYKPFMVQFPPVGVDAIKTLLTQRGYDATLEHYHSKGYIFVVSW